MDVSAVLTAHGEGVLAGVALASLLATVREARAAGLGVEALVVLDRPDETTRAVFADGGDWAVEEVDFGDQGSARNRAVELTRGDYLAFLDADDLWGDNWLTSAHHLAVASGASTIWHPEVDWYFGDATMLLLPPDQASAGFETSLLRFANYWDAMAFAPRAAHVEHPYAPRAVAQGFAYEDWHWNCQTLAAGYVHRLVPGTVHFKRRRADSQTSESARTRALPRRTRVHDYRWSGPAGHNR